MKASKREQEILDSMEPGKWYLPSELGTSQRTVSRMFAGRLLRKKNGIVAGSLTSYESGARYQKVEKSND